MDTYTSVEFLGDADTPGRCNAGGGCTGRAVVLIGQVVVSRERGRFVRSERGAATLCRSHAAMYLGEEALASGGTRPAFVQKPFPGFQLVPPSPQASQGRFA